MNVGKSLKFNLREGEALVRLSGDEFALFIEDIFDIEEIEVFVKRLKEIFENPFNIKGNILHVSCGFGYENVENINMETGDLEAASSSLVTQTTSKPIF
jgi:GGDEF domain-containing protein